MRKSESVSSAARRAKGVGLLAGAAVLAAGCAPVTTLDGERLAVRSEAFADYVERVFREQNRVASELAFALEDTVDPARLDVLETAEDALFAACADLNEMAAARRDGRRMGAFRALAAARQAPECERAAARARDALDAEGGGAGPADVTVSDRRGARSR